MPSGTYKRTEHHSKRITQGLVTFYLNKNIPKPRCFNCLTQISRNRYKRCLTCRGLTIRGENHFNWKGGLAFRKKKDERNDSAYNAWVIQVKRRDEGECKLQSSNCMGYKVVHHILSWSEYPEERYNINNGITLCQFHHPRKRDDELRLIPTFLPLVGSN